MIPGWVKPREGLRGRPYAKIQNAFILATTYMGVEGLSSCPNGPLTLPMLVSTILTRMRDSSDGFAEYLHGTWLLLMGSFCTRSPVVAKSSSVCAMAKARSLCWFRIMLFKATRSMVRCTGCSNLKVASEPMPCGYCLSSAVNLPQVRHPVLSSATFEVVYFILRSHWTQSVSQLRSVHLSCAIVSQMQLLIEFTVAQSCRIVEALCLRAESYVSSTGSIKDLPRTLIDRLAEVSHHCEIDGLILSLSPETRDLSSNFTKFPCSRLNADAVIVATALMAMELHSVTSQNNRQCFIWMPAAFNSPTIVFSSLSSVLVSLEWHFPTSCVLGSLR
mmetsp:Transcript_15618/g.51109  ORF Transcript_15618/g.51109 Transcript_15618/m.51109 type:complete len:332 (-) Transcript_15618:1813-2808(-)